MIANVKIEQDKENWNIHRVFIDRKEIKRVRSIDFAVSVECVPEVTVGIVGGCDFEAIADVCLDYSPETVKEACKILQKELLKHGDLYDGFLSSIKSAVIEYAKDCYAFGGDSEILAEEILDRIIGEE